MSSSPYYVALGDNLSIDMFAGGPGRGAASLLYRCNGEFRDFVGCDLRSRIPDLAHVNLASDRATAAVVSMNQIPPLEEIPGDLRVATLTVGLNDFIRIWGADIQTGKVAAAQFRHHLDEVLGDIRRIAIEDALVLVTNIYDPMDGTGDYEGFGTADWEDGQIILDLFNRTIGEVSDDHGALIVDVHEHFRGHGFAFEDESHPHHDPLDPTRWYIQRSEANDRGASEIRRLFWRESRRISRPAPGSPE
jgi:hypothetical protein